MSLATLIPLPTAAESSPQAWERFFYAGRAGYAMRSEGGRFIPLPQESQVRAHLEMLGVPRYAMNEALCTIREKHHVLWIGPIAGYSSGIHQAPDAQGVLLVTTEPAIVKSSPGTFDLINRIVTGLFWDDDNEDQFHAVMGWLRQARANVKAGRRRPLPALAMVGPRNAGKSLFLEIARLSLGGRSAPAYRAITNENGFNADVLGAELLVVDDEVASRDNRARSRFGQSIKNFLFAASVRVEAKNRDAFSARPVHALAIALNNEAQHVQVLPEMDDSLRDKISLIKTGRADITPEESYDKEAFMARIVDEMPAFLDWLEKGDTPPSLIDTRTGCRAWQHPDILETLSQISPESRLWELICQCWKVQESITQTGFWRGTSAELERALNEGESTRHSARTLLSWNGALGVYLAGLADGGKHGVTRGGQSHGIQTWKISRMKD
jgi:hypothetical protein